MARVYTVQKLVGVDQTQIVAGAKDTDTAAGIARRLGALAAEKVALGSVTPISVPASFAV